MGFDLAAGLTVREVGRLFRGEDASIYAMVLAGEPEKPMQFLIGSEHALRTFIFDQNNTAKPLFGFENFFLCFKERIFHCQHLASLSDFERRSLSGLIRDFVDGPIVTISVDLAKPDPLKKFKVIDSDKEGGAKKT